MTIATNTVRLSVVVPTCDRPASLGAALRSFAQQSLDPRSYEILVVDNHPSPATEKAARAALDSWDGEWRYVPEPRPGLHNARNRGIVESRAEVVVFGDDDIHASGDWLSAYANEFESEPRTGVAGGPVRPLWQAEPPEWVFQHGSLDLHIVFALLDHGAQRCIVRDGALLGCNFAARRSRLIRVGGSPPDTFPPEFEHLSGAGECELIERVERCGNQVVYLPAAEVGHEVTASRLQPAYFLARHRRFGIEDAYSFFRLTAHGRVAPLARWGLRALKRSAVARSRSHALKDMLEAQREWARFQQAMRLIASRSLRRYILRPEFLSELGSAGAG